MNRSPRGLRVVMPHLASLLVIALLASLVPPGLDAARGTTPVAEAAVAAPIGPFPDCTGDDIESTNDECLYVDEGITVAASGVFGAGSTINFTTAVDAEFCGFVLGLNNCIWSIGQPTFNGCAYLHDGDPTDLRSCGFNFGGLYENADGWPPFSSRFTYDGGVGTWRGADDPIPLSCQGGYNVVYSEGGPPPDNTWAILGPQLTDCDITVNLPRPTNLLGPSFVRLETQVRVCNESVSGCDGGFRTLRASAWVPVDGDLAPSANFEPVPAGGDGLRFTMQNTSIPFNEGATTYEWDFGDGTTSTEFLPTHTFESMGAKTVRLTMIGENGARLTHTEVITLAPPELSVVVANPDAVFGPGERGNRFDIGDVFTVRVIVRATEGVGRLKDVRPADQILTLPSQLEFAGTPISVVPRDFRPGDRAEYDVAVRAVSPGRVTIASTWQATDIEDQPAGPWTSQFDASVDGMKVTITADPDDFELEEGPDGPIPREFDVTVEVENLSGEAIALVQGDETLSSRVVVGEEKLIRQVSGPTVGAGVDETQLGPLGAGEKKTLAYRFEATGNGLYELESLIRYTVVPGGATATAVSTARVRVGLPPTIKANLRYAGSTDALTSVNAGGRIAVFLDLENTSNTATVTIDRQALEVAGKAGGGYLTDTADSVPFPYTSGNVPVPARFEIAPGETVSLEAWVVASPVGSGSTRSVITFEPTGRIEDPLDGSRALSVTDFEYEDDRDELELSMLDRSGEVGETTFVGVVGALSRGFIGQSLVWLENTFCALVDIPAAIADGRFGLAVGDALAAFGEFYLTYSYLSDEDRVAYLERVAVQVAEAEGKAVGAVQAEFEQHLTEVFEAYETGDTVRFVELAAGDLTTVAWEVGLLEAGAVKLIEGAQQTRAALAVAQLTRSGLANVKTGSIVLRRAAHAWGYSADVVTDLAAYAKSQGLNITVKPRDPGALKLIEGRAARPKPEWIKPKTVSDIDIDVLGFPATSRSMVGMRTDLATAIPDVAELRRRFDVAGYDPDLFPAVQKRWEKRLEELEKYLPELKAKDGTTQTHVFNTKDNGLPDGIGVTTRQQFDMVNSQPQTHPGFVELRLDGRPVTSDMDVLSITQSNGVPLTREQRVTVYKELQDIAEIQHPESATWLSEGDGAAVFGAKKNVFEEFASDVAGTSPAMQFGGDGKLYAVRYNKNSVFYSAEKYQLHWDGGFRTWGNQRFSLTEGTVDFRSLRDVRVASDIVAGGGWSGDDSAGQPVPSVQTNAPGARPLRDDGAGGVQQYRSPAADTSRSTAGQLLVRSALGASGGEWVDVAPSEFDGASQILVLPQTFITSPAAAGDATVASFSRSELSTIATTSETLLRIDDFFLVGQRVVIDPGGPNEELAVVTGVEPLRFAAPLVRAHEPGELVIAIGGQTTPVIVTTTAPPSTAPIAPPPAEPTTPPIDGPDPTAAPPAPTGVLPPTGGGEGVRPMLGLGAMLALAGAALLGVRRRRLDVFRG